MIDSVLSRPDSHTDVDATTGEILARWTVPGAAIGISREGETSFSAYGITSLETQQPVTPETVFRVASISKPFTATLAMTLVEEGVLDLDRPIVEYLPGVDISDADSARQGKVTMRHLLSHTAGIDCELATDLAEVGTGDDATAQAIAMFGSLHQWADAGEVMSYGNTGYWLAGHVIATLLGTTFEDAMRERVFRPLGLERSVYTAEEAIVYPVALGHALTSAGDGAHELIRSYAYPRARRPSGGVISTVVDLMRFAEWHMGDSDAPVGISDDRRRAMQEPVIRLRAADTEGWGLGWDIREATDGTRVIGHGGSYDGFQTLLTIVPARRFAFAILTNSARGGMANADIERHVLATELGLELPKHSPVVLDAEALAVFAGTYRQPLAQYDFAVADGALEATIRTRDLHGNEQPVPSPVRFEPIGDRDFLVMDGDYTGTHADFQLDPATGRPHRVRIGVRIANRMD